MTIYLVSQISLTVGTDRRGGPRPFSSARPAVAPYRLRQAITQDSIIASLETKHLRQIGFDPAGSAVVFASFVHTAG